MPCSTHGVRVSEEGRFSSRDEPTFLFPCGKFMPDFWDQLSENDDAPHSFIIATTYIHSSEMSVSGHVLDQYLPNHENIEATYTIIRETYFLHTSIQSWIKAPHSCACWLELLIHRAGINFIYPTISIKKIEPFCDEIQEHILIEFPFISFSKSNSKQENNEAIQIIIGLAEATVQAIYNREMEIANPPEDEYDNEYEMMSDEEINTQELAEMARTVGVDIEEFCSTYLKSSSD